jgi:hypothetical protein
MSKLEKLASIAIDKNLPRNPPQRALPPQDRDRWADDVAQAFERMGPHALCVVGTRGPASLTLMNQHGEEVQRIGGNKGCWPLKLASSAARKDTITATYNRGPFFWCGMLIRIWCETDEHEKRLSKQVAELLGVYREDAFGETMLSGFIDVGPNFSLEMFELEIRSIAERMNYAVWDDGELRVELERRARARMAVGGRW